MSKFASHDIVFLGEYHRIKHDPELVQALIPRLYEAGVRNLGLEFTCVEDQEAVDVLLSSGAYDESLVRKLFRRYVFWPYEEYLDIYRRAWELNRSLPPGVPRFRIVNLMYAPEFWRLGEDNSPEDRRKVWHKGDSDTFMAGVIFKEFTDKRQKALIYSGAHHAFTSYRQPVYDFSGGRFIRFGEPRMGNLVHEQLPEKTFFIFLHSPWRTLKAEAGHSYPVGGVIDRLMRSFPDKRVGFDVKGSPFAGLRDGATYYSAGYNDFNLGNMVDGYIYQKRFSEFEGRATDHNILTDRELPEIIKNLPIPGSRKRFTTAQQVIQAFARDADIRRRFQDLE